MKAVARTMLAAALLLAVVPSAAAQEGRDTVVGERFRDCAACPEMVVVPAGSFMMGSPVAEEERWDVEGPRHRVTIGAPFAVGAYEVTFAEWNACAGDGGCDGHRQDVQGWGRGDRPVVGVDWEQAQGYARWLSRETGEEYRLLTESEWEYVARAGTTTARYWGEAGSEQCHHANGADAAARAAFPNPPDSFFIGCSDTHAQTAPVGSFQPNAFGLYDVLGNVWEWTEDCWNESYSGAPDDGSAWRTGDCSRRVLRGGSWRNGPGILRAAFRFGDSAGLRNSDLGFRVARAVR